MVTKLPGGGDPDANADEGGGQLPAFRPPRALALRARRKILRDFPSAFGPPAAKPSGDEVVIASLYRRIASLANTGLLACGEGEIYAGRALTRCLAEHWLRLMSIAFLSAPTAHRGDLGAGSNAVATLADESESAAEENRASR